MRPGRSSDDFDDDESRERRLGLRAGKAGGIIEALASMTVAAGSGTLTSSESSGLEARRGEL